MFALSAVLGAVGPDEWGYVAAAYLLTIVILVAYAAWTIIRGRRVCRQLPPEDRRWL